MTVIARTRAEIVAQDDLARALSRGDVQGVHKARLAVAVAERDRAREQLQGAVEALEEIFDDLEDAPMSSYWPGAHHARQVAEMALERLRGGQ